jgi:hypothetical protein
MKIKSIIFAVAAAFGVLAAPQADAIILTQGDAFYLGSINDGIPSNPTDEASYINFLKTLAAGAGDTDNPAAGDDEIYNRVGSTVAGPFPTAVTTGSLKDETGTLTVNSTGFTYVLAKYDAGDAGSLVWFINGSVSEVTLPATLNGKGLSHISLYDPGTTNVPDGGATLMLLGLAVTGIGAAVGRLKKA